MGKIISPPKAPDIVLLDSPQAAAAQPVDKPAAPTPPTPEEQRKADLLKRNRGVLGTIQTGFRGLLDLAADAPKKKTLLGE